MSTNNVLSDRDVNAAVVTQQAPEAAKVDVKSMEYHRQVLQSKLDENKGQATYISPSDTIKSPCTAKLIAYRSKQAGKNAKPRSLFAKTSTKNLNLAGGSMFGDKIPSPERPSLSEDPQ